MNTTRYLRGLVIFFVTAALTAGMQACSSRPVKQQQQVQPAPTNHIVETRQSIVATRTQLSETLASLNALMQTSPDKLNQAYSRYATNVDEMRKRQVALLRHTEEMRKNGRGWLAGWQTAQREINNPEIRTITQKQHEQLETRLDQTADYFHEAAKALAPLVSNMEDVRKALGNNLTPQNLEQIAQTRVVQTADANAAAVARDLDVAINEFTALTASIAPTPAK